MWRELINQFVRQDFQTRMSNPGVENFGELVRTAMNLDMQKAAEGRQEASGARNVARTALYSRYPKMAAQDLGVDATKVASATPILPGNARPTKFTVDETGQVTQTYETPGMVEEKDYAKMYNDYVTEIRKTNAQWSHIKTYKPVPIPTFTQWKQEAFGQTSSSPVPLPGGGTATPVKELSDLNIPVDQINEESIQYTLQQHPEVTREQLIESIKKAVAQGQ